MRVIDGKVRKVAIPVVVFSIAGWIITTAGFAAEAIYEKKWYHFSPDEYAFPYWCFIVTGPVLFAVIFLHLAFGKWYLTTASQFLALLYIVCGGGILYFTGSYIHREDESDYDYAEKQEKTQYYDYGDYAERQEKTLQTIQAQFAGTLISVVFLVVYMLMTPCFTDVNTTTPADCLHRFRVAMTGQQSLTSTGSASTVPPAPTPVNMPPPGVFPIPAEQPQQPHPPGIITDAAQHPQHTAYNMVPIATIPGNMPPSGAVPDVPQPRPPRVSKSYPGTATDEESEPLVI